MVCRLPSYKEELHSRGNWSENTNDNSRLLCVSTYSFVQDLVQKTSRIECPEMIETTLVPKHETPEKLRRSVHAVSHGKISPDLISYRPKRNDQAKRFMSEQALCDTT